MKVETSNLESYKNRSSDSLYIKIEDLAKCRNVVLLDYKGPLGNNNFKTSRKIIVRISKVFIKNRIDETNHDYCHIVTLEFEEIDLDEAVNLANKYIDEGMEPVKPYLSSYLNTTLKMKGELQ